MSKEIAIVIDTDIVRAASGSKSKHANLCAEILFKIYEYEYFLALSKKLEDEWFKQREQTNSWDNYISPYSFLILSELKNRGRIKFCDIDIEKGHEILKGFSDPGVKNRVEKDLHIILTAICADKRLISGNRRERHHFRTACEWASFLKEIIWPFPLKEVPEWLANGANEVKEYFLCDYEDDK